MIDEQKRFKATGYAIFAVGLGTVLCRLMVFSLDFSALNFDPVLQDFIFNAIFSFTVQIICCFLIPMFIYKHFQGISYKQVFIQSNFKKPKWWLIPVSILLGLGALCVTITVSSLWRVILMGFGYIYPESDTIMPAAFNIGYFIAALLFTAVLPAFCEEFAIRGTFLTTLKNSWGGRTLIVLMGLSFGLFHQNISQVFYTALFGAFLAFLVIKTGSIFPAMIIHFTNNALAVLIDYAGNYGWGDRFMDKIFDALNSLGLLGLLFLAAAGLALIAVLTQLIIVQSRKEKNAEVEAFYKPCLREAAFYIGAICLTALTTILSFFLRF